MSESHVALPAVTRYTPSNIDGTMEEWSDGGWVSIEDYDALVSRFSDGTYGASYRMGWNMAIDTVLGVLECGALRKDVTPAELADHVRVFKTDKESK